MSGYKIYKYQECNVQHDEHKHTAVMFSMKTEN